MNLVKAFMDDYEFLDCAYHRTIDSNDEEESENKLEQNELFCQLDAYVRGLYLLTEDELVSDIICTKSRQEVTARIHDLSTDKHRNVQLPA